MAEFSRVKKFEELRSEIETDQKGTSQKPDSFKINQNINNLKEEPYIPTHERVFNQGSEEEKTNDAASFKNEYLDSFIQEVRDYNIQKGIRESEDTKLDILQQLTSQNREKRANYIKGIADENTENIPMPNVENVNASMRTEETLEISRQVFNLLNEKNAQEDGEGVVEDLLQEEKPTEVAMDETPATEPMEEKESVKSLDERIAILEKELNQPSIEDNIVSSRLTPEEEAELSSITKKELLEQTMQLKVKMDQYEDELSGINNDVDSNNRLLNVIITILIVALLGVIGVVAYWLISGGII